MRAAILGLTKSHFIDLDEGVEVAGVLVCDYGHRECLRDTAGVFPLLTETGDYTKDHNRVVTGGGEGKVQDG